MWTLLARFLFGTPDEEVQLGEKAENIYLRSKVKRLEREIKLLREKLKISLLVNMQ